MPTKIVYVINNVVSKGGTSSKPAALTDKAFWSKADIAPAVNSFNDTLTGNNVIEKVIVEEMTVHDWTLKKILVEEPGEDPEEEWEAEETP